MHITLSGASQRWDREFLRRGFLSGRSAFGIGHNDRPRLDGDELLSRNAEKQTHTALEFLVALLRCHASQSKAGHDCTE